MTFAKTAKIDSVQNKGQRAVIVAVLMEAKSPLTVEQIAERIVKKGYQGKSRQKGQLSKWAMEKAGGFEGSVKYHLRYLIAEGRVKELNEAKPARKPKADPTTEVAPEATPTPAETEVAA